MIIWLKLLFLFIRFNTARPVYQMQIMVLVKLQKDSMWGQRELVKLSTNSMKLKFSLNFIRKKYLTFNSVLMLKKIYYRLIDVEKINIVSFIEDLFILFRLRMISWLLVSLIITGKGSIFFNICFRFNIKFNFNFDFNSNFNISFNFNFN